MKTEERIKRLEEKVEKIEEVLFLDEDDKSGKQFDSISLQNFLDQCNTPHHKDKIVALTYYLDEHKGKEQFNTGELRKYYRKARLKPPENISDIVSKACEEEDLFMKVDTEENQNIWAITRTGRAKFKSDILVSEND